MTPEQAAFLKDCNGFGRASTDDFWLPYRRAGLDDYFTPAGLRARAPDEFRPASHTEIVAEMDSRNEVPIISMLGLPNG